MSKPIYGGVAPQLFQGYGARAVLVSERGLYRLTMRSDKPAIIRRARALRRNGGWSNYPPFVVRRGAKYQKDMEMLGVDPRFQGELFAGGR